MELRIEGWEVANETDGSIRLSGQQGHVNIRRDDDDLIGERWFFDYEPIEGEPVSEQFRARDETDLRTEIETMIEKHT